MGTETDTEISHIKAGINARASPISHPIGGTSQEMKTITKTATTKATMTRMPMPSVGKKLRNAIWMQSPMTGRLPFKSSIAALTSAACTSKASAKMIKEATIDRPE